MRVQRLRLGELQQNSFFRLGAVGVLDSGIDLVEESVVVEVALRVEQRRLVERVAGVDGNGLGNRRGPREGEPGNEHLAHENLLAFSDAEGDVDLVCVGGFDGLADFNVHLLESMREVGR